MIFYGIEKLSLVDYDGYVASTVFTGACNFRCGFCHNGPLVEDYASIPQITDQEIFDYLKKRKGIVEGVCITGGEPTLQKELPSFCSNLKNLGLKVKVDTNGTNPEMVKTLAENGLADYFAMDIKNDKENYAKIIGLDKFDTKKVEQTVEFFLSHNFDFEFRTTLINEFHQKENIEKIGQWIQGTKKYFMQKYKDVETCLTHDYNEISLNKAKEFLEIIKKYIPNAKLRGYDL